MIKILFVDDNPFALVLATILREDYKFNVIIKTNLDDAEYLLTYDPGEAYYDFIVLDVTIGGRLGGWDFAKKLINEHNVRSRKIVMYSARINEIQEELSSDYPQIHVLDKTKTGLLSNALKIFEGDNNGK